MLWVEMPEAFFGYALYVKNLNIQHLYQTNFNTPNAFRQPRNANRQPHIYNPEKIL